MENRSVIDKVRRRLRGFTLLEVLVALAMLAVLVTTATNSFSHYVRANYDGELRFEGVQAAQTELDSLRYDDVESMPTSGTDAKRTIQVDSGRSYDVYVSYCTRPAYCTSNAVRHLAIEVRRLGKTVYTTETVYTALDTSQGSSSSSSAGAASSGAASSSSSSRSSSSSVASSVASSAASSSHSSAVSSSSSSSRSSSSSSVRSSSSSSARCRRSYQC